MRTPQNGRDVTEKIQQVETGLVVPRVLRSDEPTTASLWERMEHYKVPGLSIAVISDYQVDWARAYGIRDARQPTPVTTDTLFQVGSISKLATAVAVLRLVERGVLDLETDINDFLRSWNIPSNGPWQPRVTLRHLLSHTGGITVHLFPGYARDDPVPSLLEVLDGLPPAKNEPVRVDAIPGVHFRYSSGGYAVLEQLLIDRIRLPFPDIMRELVLVPLGMEHSTFEQPLSEPRWRSAATGHRRGGQPVAGGWFVYPEMAQGGLWTTPSDLARLVLELQRVGAGMASTILSKQMANQMFCPHVEDHVGLGIFLERRGSSRGFSHMGGNEGFESRLIVFFDPGFGAVVMTNGRYGFLIDEVLHAVATSYGWPGFMPDSLNVVPLAGRGDSCVGLYELRPGVVLRVTRRGDALYVEPSDQEPLRLYPASETRFFMKAVNAEITFVRSDTGEVTSLVLHQSGRDTPARRI